MTDPIETSRHLSHVRRCASCDARLSKASLTFVRPIQTEMTA